MRRRVSAETAVPAANEKPLQVTEPAIEEEGLTHVTCRCGRVTTRAVFNRNPHCPNPECREVLKFSDPYKEKNSEREMASNDEAGETVTATWGEELFSPKQFHTFKVGPFSATTTLRIGEDRTQAVGRLMRELEKVAEAERQRKRASFLAAIDGK